MKILARSFLLDITLVWLASFTLVGVLWDARTASLQSQSGCTEFIVAHQQPDGSQRTFRIQKQTHDVDQIRAELVQQLLGRPDPQAAAVQWYRESTDFYAAADQKRIAAEASNVDARESVFQTVSARRNPESPPVGMTASSARWQEFWSQRSEKASAWLAAHESGRQAQAELLSRSLSISQADQWMPSSQATGIAWGASVWIAMIGIVWRVVCPPRSLGVSEFSLSNVRSGSATTTAAAMSFRDSWVRARQPLSVRLRQGMGWTIGLSGVAACLLAFLSS